MISLFHLPPKIFCMVETILYYSIDNILFSFLHPFLEQYSIHFLTDQCTFYICTIKSRVLVTSLYKSMISIDPRKRPAGILYAQKDRPFLAVLIINVSFAACIKMSVSECHLWKNLKKI